MEEKQQQQQKQREQYANFRPRQLSQEEVNSATARRCARCGAELEDGAKFCEECGAAVDDGGSRCTFCGATMDQDEMFCSECGNPRGGMKCPNCGALAFRHFCGNCNTPLTAEAFRQIERARQDQRVKRVSMVAQEIEQLNDEIEQLEREVGEPDESFLDTASPLDDNARKILDEYKNLFGDATARVPDASNPKPASVRKTDQESMAKKRERLRELKAKKREKGREMQQALDDLIPDPSDPPEIQRGFMCACKVVALEKIKKKETVGVWWVCNYCGCSHRQPSECTRPELGGKWKTEEIEVVSFNQTENTAYI